MYESYQFATGNGFNGERVIGALADGYNGCSTDFAKALGQDVLNFVPAAAALKVVKVIGKVGTKLASAVAPNAKQAANLSRFQKKIPANAKNSVELSKLPNGGVAAKATSPGKVPGSKAVYEKHIAVNGKTVQYTKTTHDPKGNIVHVKDKLK